MTDAVTSTVRDIDEGTDTEIRRRRRRYGVTTAALSLLMALGVVDALGWFDTYGVDDDVVSAQGGGYELRVRYPSVSRPALASPFEIEVTRRDGFDVPVEIAVDRAYLEMWDENGLVPAPSTERSSGRWVIWEFEPPEGTTMTIWYDARIEPAVQSGRPGAVAVLDGDEQVVVVEFDTRVLP